MFFLPADGDPRRLEETGIPLSWFRRELESAKGLLKLLIVDTCHAGSPADVDVRPIFLDTRGVYLLASCEAGQKSLVWERKGLSLFTYWLIQGLKGQADGVGEGAISDGKITPDELYYFLVRYVPLTAERLFARPQMPDRLVGPSVPPDCEILSVPERSFYQALEELSELISVVLELQEIRTVGVLDFEISPECQRQPPRLGPEAARYCADRMEEYLTPRLPKGSTLVLRSEVQRKLRELDITPQDVMQRDIPELKLRSFRVDALIVGKVERWQPPMAYFRVVLRPTAIPGVQANFPLSGKLPPELIVITEGSGATPPEGNLVPELLPVPTDERHPMADAEFPYRVFLRVGDRRLPGKFVGGDLYFPLSPGDVYTIEVELDREMVLSRLKNEGSYFRQDGDNQEYPGMLRVLVDGLNTHLDRPVILREDGVTKAVVAEKGAPELSAQPVPIEQASPWLVVLRSPRTRAYIPGFLERLEISQGQGGTSLSEPRTQRGRLIYREFRVVEAKDLPRERWDYSEQLGVIIVAFYSTRSVRVQTRSPDLEGTRPGERRARDINVWSGVAPDKLLAVVKVRYVRKNRWDELEAPAVSF